MKPQNPGPVKDRDDLGALDYARHSTDRWGRRSFPGRRVRVWASPVLGAITGLLGIVLIPSTRSEWATPQGIVSALLLIMSAFVLAARFILFLWRD